MFAVSHTVFDPFICFKKGNHGKVFHVRLFIDITLMFSFNVAVENCSSSATINKID
jgi:hypothetical protein